MKVCSTSLSGDNNRSFSGYHNHSSCRRKGNGFDDYVRFGFIYIGKTDDMQKPQCMLCETVSPTQIWTHLRCKNTSTADMAGPVAGHNEKFAS